jgi:hypothetical protein
MKAMEAGSTANVVLVASESPKGIGATTGLFLLDYRKVELATRLCSAAGTPRLFGARFSGSARKAPWRPPDF